MDPAPLSEPEETTPVQPVKPADKPEASVNDDTAPSAPAAPIAVEDSDSETEEHDTPVELTEPTAGAPAVPAVALSVPATDQSVPGRGLIVVPESKPVSVSTPPAVARAPTPTQQAQSKVKPKSSRIRATGGPPPVSSLTRLAAPFTPSKTVAPRTALATQRHSSRIARNRNKDSEEYLRSIGIEDSKLPAHWRQAMSGPDRMKWYQACVTQLKEFAEKHVYDLVPLSDLPKGTVPVGLKWVFTFKYLENVINEYKARLVGQGFTQREGRDYVETFSPVVQRDTLRLFLALCAHTGMSVDQYDIKSAYLNAKLDIPQYCRQPPGFEDGTGRLWKVTKALYGLKQAGRQWNQELTSTIVSKAGYTQSVYDPCLFFLLDTRGKLVSIVIIWVDDMLQGHVNTTYRDQFLANLNSTYQVKHIKNTSLILGMRLQQSPTAISLDQEQHVKTFLKAAGMEGAHAHSTPALPVSTSVPKPQEEKGINKNADHASTPLPAHLADEYRRDVGSILYVADCTRADVAFAVGRLCRHMANPTHTEYIACKRLLRYLVGAPSQVLVYKRNLNKEPELQLTAYSDASWADDRPTGKTTAGMTVFVGDGLVAWKSKLLQACALSTCEAEYMSMSMATQEVVWITNLCQELHVQVKKPVLLHCDNTAALELASNPVHHQRTKHMNARFHFIREHMATKLIEPVWVSTKSMVADGMTKALGVPAHAAFVSALFSPSKQIVCERTTIKATPAITQKKKT